MRVAAGQVVSRPGDLAGNVATAVRLVARAGDAGAALLVLPEAALCGYDEHLFARGGFPEAAALVGGDPAGGWLDPLREAVTTAGLVVLVAHPVRRPVGDVITMLELRPDGGLRCDYDKQHPDDDERAWFVPGDGDRQVLLDVNGAAVAPAICSDAGEPGHAPAAAAAGAVVYALSAAWFAGSERRRDRTLARCAAAGMAVVHAGATGPSAGRRGTRSTVGGSAVVDPGGVVARLGEEEGLVVGDVAVPDPSPTGRRGPSRPA